MLKLIYARLHHLVQCRVCRERLLHHTPVPIEVERVMPDAPAGQVERVSLPVPRTPAGRAIEAHAEPAA